MKKQRILKLAAYMERVKPENYSQDTWASYGGSGSLTQEQCSLDTILDNPGTVKVKVKEGACGTTACVFGHAVAALPEAKLMFYANSGEDVYPGENGTFEVHDVGVMVIKDGEVFRNFDAAVEALGIPRPHAELLFGADRYTFQFYGEDATPQMVAARLRQYAQTGGVSVDSFLNGDEA
jgi:hypothetical protein